MSKRLAFVFLTALSVSSACKEEKSRWDTATKAAESAVAAKDEHAPKVPVKTGADFNKLMPADGIDGTKRTAVAEDNSRGYVEWKYKKDDKDLVTITIVDAADKPEVKSKFANATEKLEGYPVYNFGKNQSSILVNDRYQVKIISQTMDAEARKPWFSKVDLKGLAAL